VRAATYDGGVPNPVIAELQRAVRLRGGEPLLTWYGAGARIELSVRTFANWVDKTANLIEDLDAAGGTVAGIVSRDHPGSWMSLVWPLAAWQRGCTYTVSDGPADLVVTGPGLTAAVDGIGTIACSLHPLALGLRDLPVDVLDYTGEALARPDAHWALEVDAAGAAWTQPGRSLTHGDLAALPSSPGRTLVQTSDAFGTLAAAVLAPLLGGGSCVLVDEPADAARLASLCRSERAVLA
jgi:uncharacterized protein (TIGR03089 family)